MELDMIIGGAATLLYLVYTLYVNHRISSSFYLNKDRKKLHRVFIWLVPFLGPLMIRNFWKKKKSTRLEITTKDKRKIDSAKFYESGIGII